MEFKSDSRFELDIQIHIKQHGRGNECDLWKLTEFKSDSRFEHGRGNECDLWKLTEFKSNSLFELGTQIHIK
ncbi:hypothetical protein Taro_053165 [Colocasia esculenta]|uniref:Uncharacterized protein n=1 Tax=Colocasia esculenta TaxID=4460 RepID=A0A843XKH3_COLES|nr:hypothetical protein [Colocasia esculenta]